ncbi:MAG: Lrp/AsnC family transcriptional regulator [Acidobacteria bacterium]|nr:Lrp/AsnC family transcriptional regulator [Acidobacteriota bacterium]
MKQPLDDELDEMDLEILRLLQQNGRMTNAALAEAVGLTPTPMLQRIKKLENRGVIRGYRAVIDPLAMGHNLLAYVAVQMTEHKLHTHKGFVDAVLELPEVLECHHISGEEDFLLKVLTKDMLRYENFLLHKLTGIPGIARVKTTFVLSSPKMETAIPIESPIGGKKHE